MLRPERPVLIIEDDEESRGMMATLLAIEGYHVVAASNGREGLAATRAEHPCLIVLDLMMPIMDGHEFRAEQVRDPEISHIPVVIVSARHDAGATARRLGAAAYVGKPIDLDELTATVAANCGVSE